MMKINLVDIRQRWDKAKLTKSTAFWIAVGAIILTMYIGFSRGGWVTSGTASQMAAIASQSAVVNRLAPICVAQFNQDSQKDQKLVELKTLTSSNQRTKYVEDQGWATMPGEVNPDNKVATECAKQLMLIGG
jgi:hypothetical protein